ncbi:MAG TPA: hypothetical protein ENN64_01155, partial [bacterium]|nr:hypothetical protein [bacterium]
MDIKRILSKGANLFRYQSTDPVLSLRLGELFCLISSSELEDEKSIDTLQKIIWEGIVESYTSTTEKSLVEALKLAIKDGEEKLRDFIRNDEKYSEKGVSLNYALLVVKNDQIYFATFGQPRIMVFRENDKLDITSSLIANKVDAGSMYISPYDIITLFTEPLDARIKAFNSRTPLEAIGAGMEALEDGEGSFIFSIGIDLEKYVNTESSGVKSKKVYTPGGISEKRIVAEDKDKNSGTEDDADDIKIDIQKEIVAEEDLVGGDSLQKGNDNGVVLADSTENLTDEVNKGSSETDDEVYDDDTTLFVEKLLTVRDFSVDTFYNLKGRFLNLIGKDSKDQVDPSATKELPEGLEQKDAKKSSVSKEKSEQEENDESQVSFFDKLKIVIGKIGEILSKIFNFLLNLLTNIMNFIGEKVGGFLESKYGREPWFKKYSAKLSQTRLKVRGLSRSGVKSQGYVDSSIRNKEFAKIIIIISLILLLIFGVRYTVRRNEERRIS